MHDVAIDTEMMLYERVAQTVARMIEGGVLRPGERVPSVRALSRQQGVSMSTAFQAYFLLENKGLIEARPRSGYYVRAASRGLAPEPNVSKSAAGARRVGVEELVSRVFRAAADPGIVQLGAACPSRTLLPGARLKSAMMKVLRSSGDAWLEYSFPPGDLGLRRQIARRAPEWGGSLTAEDLVITSGCAEALHLALRAVARPGDTIAIESPTYFGILQTIESLGMKALEIATSPRDGMSLDALETALAKHPVKAVLVVANFNQPLGSLMPDENKERLVHMLAKRRIPLIEDDIYGDLYFGARRPRNARAYDRDGMVLLCGSFSKTLAPGHRIGWVAPGRYQDQVERLKLMTSIATASVPQMAIAEFLHGGGYDRHLGRLRHAFATQTQAMAHAVGACFPPGTKVTRPAGGFVLWVELPKSVDALVLHARALEKKIGISPGPIFSPKGGYTNFIRLSCGHPWSERIAGAIETVGALARI